MVQGLKSLSNQNHVHINEEFEDCDAAPAAPVNNYAQASTLSGLPAKQGLYDPEYEKDACGVGKCSVGPRHISMTKKKVADHNLRFLLPHKGKGLSQDH